MESTQQNERPVSFWERSRLLVKSAVIFGMALVLWAPTNFVMNLVRERSARQKEAALDITGKWAGRQSVSGPILALPYEVTVNEGGTSKRLQQVAYFLPDKLDFRAEVHPEKRKRSIYEVAVYRSVIGVSGKFIRVPWQKLNVPADQVLWNKAVLLFHVSDALRGINEDLGIKWGDSLLNLSQQNTEIGSLPGAFYAPVPLDIETAGKELGFSMNFQLNGSEQLLFAPAARETSLAMTSDWPDPAFTGLKLPDTREVNDSGFTANWKFLNRAVPQVWLNRTHDLAALQFGADLVIPVDSYDKTERSIKYALLCILLTFAAFFLVETMYRRPLHLVQYGLAGLALVLFYTLLLSIAEYTGFNLAYLVAGAATLSLVGWFVGSILRSLKLALFITGVLAVVYTYIFSIIQLQDYALLMGSIGLFVALGVIMFFSRKLDWSSSR